ncbi:hypothetical protein L3Q82_002052 [Scortum barcoo]|uniref:Uncharacterized protein n=1 Tax=Scortum barcoo TaxID=214431 RepID=A0ACB8W128_9TELE|nr:hypothetical protein L3Q82_002052 [Scortum barcoo]
MGDVVSSHLDEGRREMITAKTSEVVREFSEVYEQQYAVALFNSDPLAGRSIFSGSLFQYLEENRKWRNRFVSVPNSYTIGLYESKTAHERGIHPKVTINCAGYKALTSMEEYMELINSSLPGLSEDSTVQTPAFTDAVRLHRQAKGHYGTWDMMCGQPPQILANLVMETLHPELRSLIGPRLKGKMQQRQRNWMLISDAVYRQVLSHTTGQYEALVEACEAQRVPLDARLRTDMDQIITSKEHISGKIRALVLPKAEQLLHTNIQPYISSILEALMEPTSRGFSEVRDVFFRELVELSKNSLNGGGKEKLGDHMERLSMLAFHPVKMQSCYEKVEQLNLEGLQQRFDVSNPSVFVSRAQILMREQMDNAVYTFEQLLHQSLEAQGEDDMCKTIQRCQDRVVKKYDYDSSTVRKKFFREALLQIIIPYMLQQLSPSFSPELPRFKELIFEDFSRFLLVENMFEEVVLQSVSKDIMMAVKEAAVQRRHNLYRDSIILTNSDPNLHLLGETPAVDWATKFGGDEPEGSVDGGGIAGGGSGRRRRQVVSMIQLDGVPLPYESCLEVPGVELIPEEDTEDNQGEDEENPGQSNDPKSPDSVNEIRDLINPVLEMVVPVSEKSQGDVTNGTEPSTGTIIMKDGVQEDVTHVTTMVEDVPVKSPRIKSSPQTILQQLVGSKKQETERGHKEEEARENGVEKIERAAQEDGSERIGEASAPETDIESSPPPALPKDSSSRGDSGFQSPTSEGLDEDL